MQVIRLKCGISSVHGLAWSAYWWSLVCFDENQVASLTPCVRALLVHLPWFSISFSSMPYQGGSLDATEMALSDSSTFLPLGISTRSKYFLWKVQMLPSIKCIFPLVKIKLQPVNRILNTSPDSVKWILSWWQFSFFLFTTFKNKMRSWSQPLHISKLHQLKDLTKQRDFSQNNAQNSTKNQPIYKRMKVE